MGVFPDFGAVGGRDLILQVLGALLTVVLIFAVLMLLVSAIVWAIAAVHGNYQGASRGRIGSWSLSAPQHWQARAWPG